MLTMTRRAFVSAVFATTVASSLAWAGQAGKLDVTGTWNFSVETEAGAGNPTFTFKQDGENLTGHYTGTFGEADVTGTLKGKDITFQFTGEIQGQQLTSIYRGTVDSPTAMKGTLEITGLGAGTFTATKK
jgi:hypothetical protein